RERRPGPVLLWQYLIFLTGEPCGQPSGSAQEPAVVAAQADQLNANGQAVEFQNGERNGRHAEIGPQTVEDRAACNALLKTRSRTRRSGRQNGGITAHEFRNPFVGRPAACQSLDISANGNLRTLIEASIKPRRQQFAGAILQGAIVAGVLGQLDETLPFQNLCQLGDFEFVAVLTK